MKGHIRERSPGHFAIILDSRDPATGKRKRNWHSFKGTKRQAQDECAKLITAINGGTYIDPSKMTVAAFFEKWIVHIAPQVSPRSHERYAEIARKNIVPLIGNLLLTKLQPVHISEAYSKALTSGRRRGNGGLSARTVTHMHRVLRQALQQALDWRMLVHNPADLVKPPKVERKPVRVLDPAGSADLIDSAREHQYFVAMLLGTLAGIRRGEITALRWRAIDLDRAQLAVVASTEQMQSGAVREKDAKSSKCRTVALPSLLVEELRRHRLDQAQRLLRLGVGLSEDHHVIMQPDGTPVKPNSLTQAVRKFAKGRAQPMGLHALRHSHASHMLASNVHPKIVQERLGHSSVAITMDIYSHLMPNMQQEAAGSVDAVLRAAISKHRA